MTTSAALAVILAVLYSAGFYLLMQRSLFRVVLGVILLGHATNLFLLAAGGPPGAQPTSTEPAAEVADPLPQAMALTAIVITFGLVVLLLALALRSFTLSGHDTVSDGDHDAVREPGESSAEDHHD